MKEKKVSYSLKKLQPLWLHSNDDIGQTLDRVAQALEESQTADKERSQ